MRLENQLALVTGASSGIGAEFARQLAARKTNLVLTARRRDRLAALAVELRQAHGVEVTQIECNLDTPTGADQLVERLAASGQSPTILINNAGFGTFGPLLEQASSDVDSMIQVNVRALTILSQRLGRLMAERGQGAILNVASFAAIAPIPRYAVYSGAKAYVVAFSQALRQELLPQGVSIGVICPGFTDTEFFEVSRHKKTSMMRATELTVQQVARAGIVGLRRGTFLIVPGWWYKLNTLTASFAPRSFLSAMSGAFVK